MLRVIPHKMLVSGRALACAVVLVIVPGLAPGVCAMDTDVIRERLMAPDDSVSLRFDPDRSSGAQRHESAELADRERSAYRLTRRYVSDNLQEWAEGGALERLESLRRTDIHLNGGGLKPKESGDPSAVALTMRLDDEIRLKIATASFERDLVYDPFDSRMSMELYQMTLPGGRTGLSVTNTYQLDDDTARVLFLLNHQLR